MTKGFMAISCNNLYGKRMEKMEKECENISSKENELAGLPVRRLFFKLAVPAVTAQVINVTYNMVDRMFIGHIPKIGADALTGVGVTMPVILGISAFAALVSMGGAPRASIALGRKQHGEAERILGTCTFTLAALSIILTVVMLLFGRQILLLFGADAQTIPYAADYIQIYCMGTVFVQLSLGLNSFITAQGFSGTSMLTVLIGAVLNCILDPVFIYLFHMGVKGAALATVISQCISSVWVTAFLCSGRSVIRLRRSLIRFEPGILLPCIALGFSPCLMQITENLVAVCFNVSLLKYAGNTAVGAVTILCTIMNFTMLLLTGMTQGAQPILSYNAGAGNAGRVKETFRMVLFSCTVGSVLIWAFCMFGNELLAGIFTNDAGLLAYTAWALRIFMSMSAIFGIQVACQYSMVALGNAPVAIFLSIYRKILLLIPLIFLMPKIMENKAAGIFMAEPIADTAAVCTTSVCFYFSFRKLLREVGTIPISE